MNGTGTGHVQELFPNSNVASDVTCYFYCYILVLLCTLLCHWELLKVSNHRKIKSVWENRRGFNYRHRTYSMLKWLGLTCVIILHQFICYTNIISLQTIHNLKTISRPLWLKMSLSPKVTSEWQLSLKIQIFWDVTVVSLLWLLLIISKY